MTPPPRGGALQVALICGAGDFPAAAAADAQAHGADIFLIGLKGIAACSIEQFPHVWVGLGEIGRLLTHLRERGISRVALIGAITRPDLADLRPDWGAVRRLPDLARLLRGGDDHVLRNVIRFLEGEQLTVISVLDVAPGLALPTGAFTSVQTSAQARADIALGRAALEAMAPFDVGQAIAVADGRILAIEAAEGTDAMLARIAAARATGRVRARHAGVLVKAAKRGQDLRADLPAIGPATIEGVIRAGLAGVALEAGRVIVADQATVRRAATEAALFITGFAPGADP